ncbi:MAG TPA: hypothetical protein VFS92_02310 [Planctomycetota bacterium]|nr:hypothetical protein [Planctomycetota bacterium]
MFRYKILELSRLDPEKRDEELREVGRAGWELVSVIDGSSKDAADRATLTYFFKRAASEDITF